MDTLPPTTTTELAAALLQAVLTLALAGLCAFLYRRYRKAYFGWWALAWGLYVFRLGMIISFLTTGHRSWLYWHQVASGWAALALLWAALVFSRQLRWRPWYLAVVLFPPLWSYVAIYRLDNFLLAAGPAVLFLSLATIWTGAVFLSYHRRVGSAGAALLAGSLILWGLHHLDYPFLRARGAWNPWGYYLDILFEVAIGTGLLLLVVDDLRRGLTALSALSGDLQRGGESAPDAECGEPDVLDALLARPLGLPAVRGTAMYLLGDDDGRFVRGAGACERWDGAAPEGAAADAIRRAVSSGRPALTGEWADRHAGAAHPYTAVLPIFQGSRVGGALVIVGDARDPFAALDEDFLIALGRQVGAALENAELNRRLRARTAELERMSARMVRQHEEERRRLSRELHDETAQVFSAVKMELGVLRESVPEAAARGLDHALALVDKGILSIREVTNALRPSLLDDLGLLPALRALATDFGSRSELELRLSLPDTLPPLSEEAELGLFRALQEGLANVARHAAAHSVTVALRAGAGEVHLSVTDDGRGLPAGADQSSLERNGHMGLAGMRERIGALGGTVRVNRAEAGGVRLDIRLPAARVAS